MSFISYAQNFEDVMLWRALKHVENGFYIDVGAWSPDLDSVTRVFYEQGWHGINIEPNPEFNQQLQDRRPHDINLQLAVGDREETLCMNFFTNPGLSTLDDTIAQRHQQAGWEVERQPVQANTLLNIWADNVPPSQDVHFLKVDVEGYESAVVRGNDWNKNRPWIVVVEATLPMSQEESHSDWEPILLNAGYHYAYFDGLNRFYVAKEHPGLLDAFKAPPNFFDDFVLYRQQEAEARATQAEVKAGEAENSAKEAKAHAGQHQAEAHVLKVRAEQVGKRMGEAERQLQKLTTQLAQHQAEAQEQLQNKEQELTVKQEELEQLQAHSQWLQNEWDAAKAKIDEPNHSSHHWWTVADGLNKELQSIYRSKLWRLNWPFRKLLQGIKVFIRFWRDLFVGLLRLPRRALRWVLARTMRFVLRREGLKNRARLWLMRHPKLEVHLRVFARQRGLHPAFPELLSYPNPAQLQGQTVTDETVDDESNHGEIDLTATLTPRAKQIYFQLKAAIEKKQKANG